MHSPKSKIKADPATVSSRSRIHTAIMHLEYELRCKSVAVLMEILPSLLGAFRIDRKCFRHRYSKPIQNKRFQISFIYLFLTI